MTRRKAVTRRRKRLSIEPLEPRRLLDVTGIWQELGFRSASGGGLSNDGVLYDDANDLIRAGHSGDPAVALTPQGQTVVAYETHYGILPRLFDGHSWVDLYSNPIDPGDHSIPNSLHVLGDGGLIPGMDPDVAVDSYGNLYVTWLMGGYDYVNAADETVYREANIYMSKGSFELSDPGDPSSDYVWTWTGLDGSDVGDGLSADGVINGAPAIAVGIDNLPVVAYGVHDILWDDMDVVAKKFLPDEADPTQGQWVELTSTVDFANNGGGVSNDTFASAGTQDVPQPVDIAIGSDNAPIVVWSSAAHASEPAEIYARRWNQLTATWEKIGGQSASDPDEDPVGGISDDNVDGDMAHESVAPRIDIYRRPRQTETDDDRDIVMVAWIDYTGSDYQTSAMYVKQLEYSSLDPTGAWVEVGVGSASGDGITGPLIPALDSPYPPDLHRGYFRYPSIDIGVDGLPVFGVTRKLGTPEEVARDTTPPWSPSYTAPGEVFNWYAWGLEAYDTGSGIAYRWLGPPGDEVPNLGVSQAQNTEILELPDGSPVLYYGADRIDNYWLMGDRWTSDGNGPYDPGFHPWGASDSEVYAHIWNATDGAWQNFGHGSGELGSVDGQLGDTSFRWNSDPVLANTEDGRILLAYIERIDLATYVRVRKFNEVTGEWEPFGQPAPLVVNMEPDEIAVTVQDPQDPNEEVTLRRYTYRLDELAIGSDPSFSGGAAGRPVLAYLDAVNTDDPAFDGYSTVTVMGYNETTDQWELLNTGAKGTADYYAAVTAGTVWNGYYIDQIDVVAGHGNEAFLSYRYVDPNEEPQTQAWIDHGHIRNVGQGGNTAFGPHGTSEIYAKQWFGNDPSPSWDGIGHLFENLTDEWATNYDMMPPEAGSWNTYGEYYGTYFYNGLNFDPSLLLLPSGDVWISFTVGRAPRLWSNDDRSEPAEWWENGEAPMILTEIAVYQFNELTGTWETAFGDSGWGLLTPPGGTSSSANAYAHSDLAIGADGYPMLVMEDQVWQMHRLQDFDLVDADDEYMGRNPNFRPNVIDEDGDPSWGYGDQEDPGFSDRIWVAEDGFQELIGASIITLQYGETLPFDTSFWIHTGTIAPGAGEEGRSYVLPRVVSAAGNQRVVTYTSLELDGAGYTTSELTEWFYPYEDGEPVGPWERDTGYHSIDLGLRSYFRGTFGGQGDGFYPGLSWWRDLGADGQYSDLVADYYDPRIMYGTRHVDFEKAWWLVKGGSGRPGEHAAGDIWFDDYYTPLPDHARNHPGPNDGGPAVGHIAQTSFIYARRYTAEAGGSWEEITSVDPYGNLLPSASDKGLNAWYKDPLLDEVIAWSPGFNADVGLRGLGGTTQDIQPVVAWNHIEMNLIQVRGWAPDDGTSANLPRLEVTEFSGTANDDLLSFGQIQTVAGTKPLAETEYIQFLLQNTGGEDLIINGIEFGGPAIFTMTDLNDIPLTYPFIIAPGSNAIVRVHAAPTEPGPIHGMLYITSNDPIQEFDPASRAPLFDSWYTLAIQGVAYTGAKIEVTESSGIENDLVISFAPVEPGGPSNVQILRIKNDVDPGVVNEALRVWLNISGTGADSYGSFRIRHNGQEYTATEVTIAPGATEEIELLFNGTSVNQDGAVGYLVIDHDNWGDESGMDVVDDRRPYLVQLVGNMPRVESAVEAGQGRTPAISSGTMVYVNGNGGLDLLDLSSGEVTTLVAAGASRPRSDGYLTVYAVSGTLFVYDHSIGTEIDLSEALGEMTGQLVTGSNPSIDGNRVVFAGAGAGGHDINWVDLNIDNGSVDPDSPLVPGSYVVIADPNPMAPADDDNPDVAGDWVVWRRGSQEGQYTVWGYDIASGHPLELSVGQLDGARLPRASGDYVAWVEEQGGSRIVLYERNAGRTTPVWLQADIAEGLAFHGSMLIWSDNRNGDFDIYGYDLPTAVGGGDRLFQLTFGKNNEVNPDIWGNAIAWRESETGKVYFSGVPSGVGQIEVPQEGATIDFGNVGVGVPRTYEFEIRNVGAGPLTIEGLVASVTSGAADVSLVPVTPILIQQGATLWVQLVLTATTTGPISGTVRIESDDPAEPVVTLDFTATAQRADAEVRDSAGNKITEIRFDGIVPVGQTGTATFYVHNTASVAELVIREVKADDPSLSFELVSGSQTLQPGGVAEYRVTWAPTVVGDLDATIEIVTNDPDLDPLKAYGQTGVPAIRVAETSGTSDDDKIEFGVRDQVLGKVPQQFTIINEGTDVLTIRDWSITGPGKAAFSLESDGQPLPMSFVLARNGGSLTVDVLFDTSDPGVFTATLSLSTNDPDDAAYTIALEGTVKTVVVMPDQLDFGQVERGQTSVSQAFWFANSGQAPLTVYSITSTDPAFTITNYSGPFVLPGGETTQAFTVTFSPTEGRSYEAAIEVHSNDPNSPAVVTLIGEGINVPHLTVAGDVSADGSLYFEDTIVGTPSELKITLRNEGNGTLRLTGWSVDNSAYDIKGTHAPGPIELGPKGSPNDSVDLTVTFSPTATTTYRGQITIVSDDPDPNRARLTISVSGTGRSIPMAADFNDDDEVDGSDFDLFQRAYLSGPYNARMDLDHDGDLDFADLGIFLAYYDQQSRAAVKMQVASYLNSPDGNDAVLVAETSTGAASGGNGKSAGSSKLAGTADQDDGRTMLFENLSAAFETGALDEAGGLQTGATEPSGAIGRAEVSQPESADVEAGSGEAIVQAQTSGGAISLSGLTTLTAGQSSLAADVDVSVTDGLYLADLSKVDPLVVPYARALLGPNA